MNFAFRSGISRMRLWGFSTLKAVMNIYVWLDEISTI